MSRYFKKQLPAQLLRNTGLIKVIDFATESQRRELQKHVSNKSLPKTLFIINQCTYTADLTGSCLTK